MDLKELLPNYTHVVEIDEHSLTSPDFLHMSLARDLDFPLYYGGNLSALSDCLGDLDTPTRIVIVRTDAANRFDWLDGFIKVMRRCAGENPALEILVEEPRENGDVLESILAKLERMEHRLDALQAQPPAPASVPAKAPASTRHADTCRNLASGSDGDRFRCGTCGCIVSDYLDDARMLVDGLKYCPQCGCKVANPEGSNALGWVGELI